MSGRFVTNKDELDKYGEIEMIHMDGVETVQRTMSFYERLGQPIFLSYMRDLIEVSRARLRNQYKKSMCEDAFILYEKYSRRDVCQLLNCKRDLSSTMYGMKRIGEDACIFVTYHKQEDVTGKEYLEGKPDYADEFLNNQIFMWDSQIGKGPESSYMREVVTAKRRRLFIKKSDAEGIW